MKYLEWVNPGRQKADGWLLGVGGKEEEIERNCFISLWSSLMKSFKTRAGGVVSSGRAPAQQV
jgi:hypothetical protein